MTIISLPLSPSSYSPPSPHPIRWAIKEDGHREPNARTLLKPVLNLFHGERGSKRWKAAMDAALKDAPRDATVRDLLRATLHHLDPAALDAPPLPARVVAAVAAGGGNTRHFEDLVALGAVLRGAVNVQGAVEGGGGGDGACVGARAAAGGSALEAGQPAEVAEAAVAPQAAAAAEGPPAPVPAAAAAAGEAGAAFGDVTMESMDGEGPAEGGAGSVGAVAEEGAGTVKLVKQLPEPLEYALTRPLPGPEDRAAGEEELKRRRQRQKRPKGAAAAGGVVNGSAAAAAGDGGSGSGSSGSSMDEWQQDGGPGCERQQQQEQRQGQEPEGDAAVRQAVAA